MFLSGKSYLSCYNAGLKQFSFRENLIDDCDLVKDNLLLDFSKITLRPDCISLFRLVLPEFPQQNHDYVIGGQTATYVANPLAGRNRCVTRKISATVTFSLPNLQTRIEYLNYQLNPLEEKCLKSTEYTRTNDVMTVDIAEAIPVKLWDTCIFSVSYGTQHFDITSKSIFVDFTTKVCGEEKHAVLYKFRGREIMTIKKMFSFKIESIRPF